MNYNNTIQAEDSRGNNKKEHSLLRGCIWTCSLWTQERLHIFFNKLFICKTLKDKTMKLLNNSSIFLVLMSIQYLQWIDHTKRVVFDVVLMFVVVFPDDSSQIRYFTLEWKKILNKLNCSIIIIVLRITINMNINKIIRHFFLIR